MSDAMTQLDAMDAESAALNARLRELKVERRQLIDAECAKVANLQIGQEIEMKYGWSAIRRYRISRITGHYISRKQGFRASYFARHIKKDGTLGKEQSVHNAVKIYPLNGEGEPIVGQFLENKL